MSFRQIDDRFFASPQIAPDDVGAAAEMGIALIVNNRPEGESADQVSGQEIERAALAAGIAYVAIPVTHAGFSEPQVTAMADALAQTDGKVLAYCRSGTRSTLLWALAQASQGADPEELSRAAMNAGYDVSSIRAVLDMLVARRG